MPQCYLGSGMEVTRGSTCTLVEGITGYESQSTGFGMMLDAVVLLAHSLGVRYVTWSFDPREDEQCLDGSSIESTT